ncbi:hypothetical protein V8245_04065 [Flavobacterium columnare]|uniref:hypothetical protein n=1 Tax=Flavobacterium columnare TaxID=996 RepID=UPI003B9E4B20
MGTESISALTAVLRNTLRKSERSGLYNAVDQFDAIEKLGDIEKLKEIVFIFKK